MWLTPLLLLLVLPLPSCALAAPNSVSQRARPDPVAAMQAIRRHFALVFSSGFELVLPFPDTANGWIPSSASTSKLPSAELQAFVAG